MLDYTAIDFETANSRRGSPCAVGLVKVRGGEVAGEEHWLFRPPEGLDDFEPFNVSIHGITPEMVAGTPRWRNVLPALLAYVGDDPLVAHNAAFDLGVLRDACSADGIEWPTLDYLCTLVLSRRAYSLPSYRLPFVSEAAGLVIEDHHDPLADARAVTTIVRSLASDAMATGLTDLAQHYDVRFGELRPRSQRGSVHRAPGGSHGAHLHAEAPSERADPDGYLYGKTVVFTGALQTLTRQTAWDYVSSAGGTPGGSVTKHTNVLVLGDISPSRLRPGASLSNKAQRAFELQAGGQDIKVMVEADFLQVLGDPRRGADG